MNSKPTEYIEFLGARTPLNQEEAEAFRRLCESAEPYIFKPVPKAHYCKSQGRLAGTGRAEGPLSARKSAFVRFRERETDREMEEFAAWALRNNEPCEICNSRQEDLEIHLMGSLGRITLTCPACYQKSVARAEGYHAALEYRDRATSGGGGFWDWLKGLA